MFFGFWWYDNDVKKLKTTTVFWEHTFSPSFIHIFYKKSRHFLAAFLMMKSGILSQKMIFSKP